jgi:hypothetical protein
MALTVRAAAIARTGSGCHRETPAASIRRSNLAASSRPSESAW